MNAPPCFRIFSARNARRIQEATANKSGCLGRVDTHQETPFFGRTVTPALGGGTAFGGRSSPRNGRQRILVVGAGRLSLEVPDTVERQPFPD
jgi:hypothetical protein